MQLTEDWARVPIVSLHFRDCFIRVVTVLSQIADSAV